MNIQIKRDDFRFDVRASVAIYNSDFSKVLLFHVEGRSFYMLPGGRVEELEDSLAAIKREVKEEIGWDIISYSFMGLCEEFLDYKNTNSHQLEIIFKGIYPNPIQEMEFKGQEGDWCHFVWVDVKDISQYEMFPEGIQSIIDGSNSSNHLVCNFLKKDNVQ